MALHGTPAPASPLTSASHFVKYAMATNRNHALRPTLWRTCRVLANRQRLRLLLLLLRGRGMRVSALAEEAGMPVPVCSHYLRMLNARGLLTARRQGRYVSYRALPDTSQPEAVALLEAVRLSARATASPAAAIYRLATAFTHPTRVAIVRLAAQGPVDERRAAAAAHCSRRAVHRHLDKLVSRRLLHRRRRGYGLARPRDALARALIRLAAED